VYNKAAVILGPPRYQRKMISSRRHHTSTRAPTTLRAHHTAYRVPAEEIGVHPLLLLLRGNGEELLLLLLMVLMRLFAWDVRGCRFVNEC
jgi:hypothetical protein